MRCPFCKFEDSKVIDSRSSNDGRVIRRRRECLSCARRFTTKEYVEETALMVVKADGRRETYDRQKLRRSLQIACKKRPVSVNVLDQIVTKVEAALRDGAQDEVPSRHVGEIVMDYLKDVDEVAYVRFASVYRNFQDKQEFMNEIAVLQEKH